MAEVYGISGCTVELLHGLNRKGLSDIQSFPAIICFQREYSQPLPALQGREHERMQREIAWFQGQEARETEGIFRARHLIKPPFTP